MATKRINFLQRRPEDPLRHPKLEVFLKSDANQNPSINQYLALKKDMDNLLIKLINFIGPIEYVSDSYFDAEKVFEYRYDLPEWDYKTTSNQVQHIDLGENMQAIKTLAFIALQSEGCARLPGHPGRHRDPGAVPVAVHQPLESRRHPGYRKTPMHPGLFQDPLPLGSRQKTPCGSVQRP
jgi:hypothetical protein